MWFFILRMAMLSKISGTSDKNIKKKETRTCLDGEEQIKREGREKDLEMER